MWFKNTYIIPLANKASYQPESLAAELEAQPFINCSSVTPVSIGWVAPIGDNEDAPLVHGSNGFMLFCLKIEEKLLPAGVVREHHLAKVKEVENKQGRKLFKDEKQSMKEELYHTLLAKAFSKSQLVHAYIDTKLNALIIDSSSNKRIEQFIKAFTNCTKSHELTRYNLISPRQIMTKWLQQHRYPGGLSITEQCILEEPKDHGGVARFSKTDLSSEGVQTCIQQGSQVISLGLNWQDQILFTLKHDLTISGVKFLDGVEELAKDSFSETAEDRHAADFAIMSETLSKFFDDILQHFVSNEPQDMQATTTSNAATPMTIE
jgi:recombination associated protein RdgC